MDAFPASSNIIVIRSKVWIRVGFPIDADFSAVSMARIKLSRARIAVKTMATPSQPAGGDRIWIQYSTAVPAGSHPVKKDKGAGFRIITRNCWKAIPQAKIDGLIDSMRRQLKAVKKARGWYTKY